MKINRFLKMMTTLTLLACFAGCGGGNDNTQSGGGSTSTATVNGTASKGLIKNGTITIYAANSNGSRGNLLTTTTTDGQGHYTATVRNYTGPVIIDATGTYTDEATGQPKTITAANPLTAAGSVSDNGVISFAVTPLTDLAYHHALAAVAGGAAVGTAIANANNEISTLFSLDITTVQPVDAHSSTLEGATAEQRAYTLYLAGISQIASDSNRSIAEVVDDLNAAGNGANTQVVTSANIFLAGNTNNQTGYKRLPITLSLAGLGTQKAGALDFTIALPTGVMVYADQGGALAPCEYSFGTSTSTNPINVVTKYTAASGSTPARVRIIVLNTNLFSNGQVGILQLNVPAAVVAASFSVERVVAKDHNGATISGVTLSTQ